MPTTRRGTSTERQGFRLTFRLAFLPAMVLIVVLYSEHGTTCIKMVKLQSDQPRSLKVEVPMDKLGGAIVLCSLFCCAIGVSALDHRPVNNVSTPVYGRSLQSSGDSTLSRPASQPAAHARNTCEPETLPKDLLPLQQTYVRLEKGMATCRKADKPQAGGIGI